MMKTSTANVILGVLGITALVGLAYWVGKQNGKGPINLYQTNYYIKMETEIQKKIFVVV